MATTIVLKNSVTTTNTPSSLAQGEVAINVTDKKVWVGNAATTPVQIVNGGPDGVFTSVTDSGLTNTRVTYAGAGGLLKDSASITTDGTTVTAGGFSGPVGATTASTGAFTTLTATNFNAASTFGFKNRIINGAMVIDQRYSGAVINTGATVPYTLDRWQAGIAYSTGATVQQSTSAPTGFINSLLVTVGTGAAASAANIGRVLQVIEGLNVADLGWGTANAKTVTLSFWVKSSLTGTFSGGIYNGAANRSYVFTYAISAANTWEQKSVTIAGDTSGTWLTTNDAGMYVNWDLGTGTTYQATASSWQATAAWATSGSVKLAATTGATWSITGVQLETGSTATTFDYRDYGRELIMCQRYYYKMVTGTNSSYANFGAGAIASTTLADRGFTPLPVNMRASPSFAYTTMRIFDGATATAVSSINANYSTPMIGGWGLDCSGAVFVVGRAGILIEGGANTGNIQFSSEL